MVEIQVCSCLEKVEECFLSEKCRFYDQNNSQNCINCPELLYCFSFFFFFSKGVEICFVEPVNFGLFCMVVSRCVSITLKKKKKKKRLWSI